MMRWTASSHATRGSRRSALQRYRVARKSPAASRRPRAGSAGAIRNTTTDWSNDACRFWLPVRSGWIPSKPPPAPRADHRRVGDLFRLRRQLLHAGAAGGRRRGGLPQKPLQHLRGPRRRYQRPGSAQGEQDVPLARVVREGSERGGDRRGRSERAGRAGAEDSRSSFSTASTSFSPTRIRCFSSRCLRASSRRS